MTSEQRQLILQFVKNMKHVAIRSQAYEAAACSRDLEKIIDSPEFKTSIEDPEYYYQKATKIFKEKFSFLTVQQFEILTKEQEKLHDQVFRQKIRQEIISKLLDDTDQQNNSGS